MATDVSVRISRNPYQGYEARFWWNGMLNRYSFECQHALAATLADDGVSDEVIEGVMDAIEAVEWSQTYPLGVVYVGEAVCDFGEPEYDPRTVAFRRPEPSPFWDWFAATLRLGAVAAPWVLLMIACRVAWAKAVAWGWV